MKSPQIFAANNGESKLAPNISFRFHRVVRLGSKIGSKGHTCVEHAFKWLEQNMMELIFGHKIAIVCENKDRCNKNVREFQSIAVNTEQLILTAHKRMLSSI